MSNLQNEIKQQIAIGKLKDKFTIAEVIAIKSISEKYKESTIKTTLPNHSIGPGNREGQAVKTGHLILFRKLQERSTYSIYEEESSNKTSKYVEGKSKTSKKKTTIPIKKNDYLGDEDVSGFIKYLAKLINGEESSFKHHYKIQSSEKKNKQWKAYNHNEERWECNSLEDAFKKYYWDKKKYQETKEILDKLKLEIRKSFEKVKDLLNTKNSENEIEFMGHCRDILKWGGVLKGNTEWMVNKICSENGLIESFSNARDILTQDVLNIDPKDWNINKQRNTCNYRMNAGYTKIYSLLCDDFIIYDSRVAATLGKLIAEYCEKEMLDEIPETLSIRVMSATGKQNRIPSYRGTKFENTHSNGDIHSEWNVKANWLLTAAIEKSEMNWKDEQGNTVVDKQEKLRALEAALFMIGYDLPDTSK